MKHFEIRIKVAYDEATVDERLVPDLRRKVEQAVQSGLLTPALHEIVEEFGVEITEVTKR